MLLQVADVVAQRFQPREDATVETMWVHVKSSMTFRGELEEINRRVSSAATPQSSEQELSSNSMSSCSTGTTKAMPFTARFKRFRTPFLRVRKASSLSSVFSENSVCQKRFSGST